MTLLRYNLGMEDYTTHEQAQYQPQGTDEFSDIIALTSVEQSDEIATHYFQRLAEMSHTLGTMRHLIDDDEAAEKWLEATRMTEAGYRLSDEQDMVSYLRTLEAVFYYFVRDMTAEAA